MDRSGHLTFFSAAHLRHDVGLLPDCWITVFFEELISFRLDGQLQEVEDVLGGGQDVIRHVFIPNDPEEFIATFY